MKHLIKILSILITFVPLIKLSAQNPTFEWAQKIGGGNRDRALHHVTDVHGNIYITGYFQNTVDFDPGFNSRFLTSNGINDIFIAKYDSLGNYKWAHAFGSIYNDDGNAITIDIEGNIVVSGYFQGTIDFNPGPAVANLSAGGHGEVFILKLDTNGNYIWVKGFGGIGASSGSAIDTDNASNIYITGRFEGTVDFDPGSNTSNLTSNGEADIYVSKIDKNGNFIWVKQMGGSFLDAGFSISIDQSGFVYTTGYFNGTADFNPSTSVNNLTSNGANDIFITKLDSNGKFIWAKGFGGTENDIAFTISTDRSKYVYLTGYFRNTVDFDPGPGTLNLISNGISDIFMLKLDTSGNLEWAKGIGGTGIDNGSDIAIDYEGNLYFASSFKGTVDFNTGSGVNNLTTSTNSSEIAILKIDSNANFLWAKNFGDGSSHLFSMSIDGAKNIVTSGYFSSLVDFNPGLGTYYINSSIEDGFIMKLSQCSDNSGTDIIDACNSYTWIDGITYTSNNNTATDTLTNTGGCDSIVHLDLTINQATSSIIKDTACDRYTWSLNNITYLSSGSYQDTILNIKGCDSIVNLDLTINLKSISNFKDTACEQYTWIQSGLTYFNSGIYYDTLTNSIGCDSILELDLVVNNSTNYTSVIMACDSFIWSQNLTKYTISGVYSDTIINSLGCDSVLFLDLTINQSKDNSINVTTCDTYSSPSGKYNWQTSGIYTDTISTTTNCDSILTINLQILNSTFEPLNLSACDTLISPSGKKLFLSGVYNDTISNVSGCDSINTINLTILNTQSVINATVCNNYTSPSGLYNWSTSGTYYDTLTNSNSCDSLVTINLTVLETYSTIQPIACNQYLSPSGKTFTSTGNYLDTIANASACDSVITILLTINNSTTAIIYDTTCVSYLSPSGKSYSVSGVYKDTIINSAGCDSIMDLNIVVLNKTTSAISINACDSLIAPSGKVFYSGGLFNDTIVNKVGCDSIITIFLTVNQSFKSTDNVIACNDYRLPNGQIVTSNGLYTSNLIAINGCDSIVTTNLTINAIDTSITMIGNTLISSQNNATYQWLDCNANFNPIPNATNQSFTPSQIGSYAVKVSSSCSDTSSCINVTTVGLNEKSASMVDFVRIYPNPFNELVYVDNLQGKWLNINIYTSVGNLVKSLNSEASKIELNIVDAKGVYFIHIISNDDSKVFRVVKK